MLKGKSEILMLKLFHSLCIWDIIGLYSVENTCTSASKGKCNWIGMLIRRSHLPLACMFVFLLKLNDLTTTSVILGLAKYVVSIPLLIQPLYVLILKMKMSHLKWSVHSTT